MSPQPYQYLLLFVPLSLTLLGAALAACWRVLPHQRFLLWLAIGYIVPSLTLSLQSLLDNQQLAQWSVVASALYLGGFWCLAQGLALRYGSGVNAKAALLISLTAQALITYYAWFEDQLWTRAYILSLALGLLLLLPIPLMFRRPAGQDTLEKVLRISYAILVLYALARAFIVLTFIPAEEAENLTTSIHWVLMLSIALLFSIWFLLVLLTITLRDVLRVLHDERNHDSLTRLLNRRAFFEAAESSLGDPRQGPWTLLVCDIDHFKMVNDTWGHQAGDKVLHWFGQTLLGQTRRGDLAARFGGEEFAVLLPRSQPEDAVRVAERIRQLLAQAPEDDTRIRISASFGLVPVSSREDLNDALARADTLLYEAKRAGRDRIHAEGLDANLPDQAA